ncbi:hypothetical protein RYX56_05965 [Alkalihalophilus lindianensis]|uniref:HEAT repeat-containing protein n=1 Tax=Alkalihalophilus lindianensis TaxID=1630542 RepID=A0ABU3X7P7_9BACI|nr:hypothetical protein [Alkalihalophilus lindianensis]MDV2683921.1 hypothetical protein [Alkalihalophilus lindianensis]
MMKNNQNEMNWKKFSYVVKQMQSDNPDVRELAVQSLDRMVESEVTGSQLKLTDSSSTPSTSKKDDVMHKIRLLQKDKEKKQVRRKKWFAVI